MLERVWKKSSPFTLLVGMQTSTATMENRVEILLKTGNRTAIWPSNPTVGHTHQGNQNWKRHMYPKETHVPQRDTCTPVFIAALFTISRTWKQLRHILADEWIRKLWYIYTMEYYSAIKKECIWVSSNKVDETGAYYSEWSKSERETAIQYINAYIWNLRRQ